MTLANYRDISRRGSDTKAGFQFEFHCGSCARTWKSPFEPYRRGQLSGIVHKLAYFLGDRGSIFRASSAVANAGESRARDRALQQALELVEQQYTDCPECQKAVCEECWNPGARLCAICATKGASSTLPAGSDYARAGGTVRAAEGAGAGLNCPNCSSPISGGRFCPECGFDMASTHKSCPGCGTLLMRSARFCTDCGHGF